MESKDVVSKAKSIKSSIISLFEQNVSIKQSGEVGYYSEQFPRAFVLYGGWGTGKTRLLEELEIQLLDDREEGSLFDFKIPKQKYDVVWFRPWEYEDSEDNLDQLLLQHILQKSVWWKKILRSTSYYFERFLFGVVFLLLLILPPSPFRNLVVKETVSTFPNLYLDDMLLIAVISILLVGVIMFFPKSLLKYTKIFKLQGVGLYNAGVLLSTITKPMTKQRKIQEEFDQYLGENKKIFVFIDDLDRCSKETVIQILEHIKHYYNVRQIYFVCAIDRKALGQYVSECYEYQSLSEGEGYKRGLAFLDKLFPNSYNLRYLNLREVFDSALKEEKIYDHLTDKDREMYYQFIEFYATFNIRKVKELIRKFAETFRKIGYTRIVKNDQTIVTLDQIFRWCLINEFYSEVFDNQGWRHEVYSEKNVFQSVGRNDQKGLLSSQPLGNREFDIFTGFFWNVTTTWLLDKVVNDSIDEDFNIINELNVNVDVNALLKSELNALGRSSFSEECLKHIRGSEENIAII